MIRVGLGSFKSKNKKQLKGNKCCFQKQTYCEKNNEINVHVHNIFFTLIEKFGFLNENCNYEIRCFTKAYSCIMINLKVFLPSKSFYASRN